jgi:acyl-CoA synthetase (AMP-forming)/AMP-acid ligase II
VTAPETFAQQLSRLVGSSAPAIMAESTTCSAQQLIALSAGAADWLDAIGAPAGRPVAALVSTGMDAGALMIAGATTGRPLAPLGPRLTERELVACLGPLDSEVLVAEPACAELADAVARATGRRLAVLPLPPATTSDAAESWEHSTRTLRFDQRGDELAAVLHTSGTSGVPKMVPLRHDRLGARVRINAAALEMGPGAVVAMASPFHHIAGLGMMCVGLGSGAVLVPIPRFTLDAWRALYGRGVTHALLVPTMIDMLLAEGLLNMPGLRLVQYGTAPIHPDTLAAAMALMPNVRYVNLYGQTEGTPITAMTPDDHVAAAAGRPELLASVGRAVTGLELRIDEPDADGIGEVVARAPHLFKPDADGWLRTGDLGRVDDEGYLYLAGRKGDMIIRGGENIYPIEVEQVIDSHPQVRESAVVGVSDRRWGEIVRAYVVPVDAGSPPDTTELARFARTSLAGFKIPVEWEFVAELPRNALGKVMRRLLNNDERLNEN